MTVDEQGYPLIPHEKLPFVDASEAAFCGVKWGPVPKNYFDAMRYGRNTALDLLRVAPQGHRTRTDDIKVFGACYLLEMQLESRPKRRSHDSTAIYAFWSTLLHFVMTEPTYQNVERFRICEDLNLSTDEIGVLRAQVRHLTTKLSQNGRKRSRAPQR